MRLRRLERKLKLPKEVVKKLSLQFDKTNEFRVGKCQLISDWDVEALTNAEHEPVQDHIFQVTMVVPLDSFTPDHYKLKREIACDRFLSGIHRLL